MNWDRPKSTTCQTIVWCFACCVCAAIVRPGYAFQVDAPEQPKTQTDAQTEATPPDPGDTGSDTQRAPERENDDTQGTAGQGLAQQIKQAAELATAFRLRDELASLLSEEGRASTGVGEAGDTRLAGLATRCEVLAQTVASDEARVLLLSSQARANAALVQIESDGSELTRQRRLQILRNAADQIRAIQSPSAKPSADYWQLLADLAETANLDTSVRDRQALGEDLLTGYVTSYAQSDAGREYVVDARLSLARLLDDRGEQAGVAQQLKAVGKLPEHSARFAEAQRLHASVNRIGRPIKLEAVTTGLVIWRLSDQAGQPVLLHVYADAVEPSVQMIDQIKQTIAVGSLSGARVVSLRVGDPLAESPTTPWPTLPIDLEPGGILERLGVVALPTLVWIDGQGKVASIGHTAAVLDQMPAKPDDPDPDPDVEEQDEPAPGVDPTRGTAAEKAGSDAAQAADSLGEDGG